MLIVISGCDIFIDNGPSYFTIQVDSVSVADSLHTTDTLSIKFRGTVGTNACDHFFDIENSLQNNQLDVTLWGWEENSYRNTNCVSKIVPLENVEYRTTQLSPGTFTIVIHQKNGSTLTRTVQITN
jgi:hypothetical protein